jgi:restriction system protein
MTAASRAIQKYFRQVDDLNRRLSERWRQVTGHLRYGLSAPIATSGMLYKQFRPPSDFAGSDGKLHRKPIRALYGLGSSAQANYESDMASYTEYSEALKAQVEKDNAAVAGWLARAQSGDKAGVSWYCNVVIPGVLPQVPGGIQEYTVTSFSASDRRLVIERLVPDLDVVPEEHRFEIRRNLELYPVGVSDRDRQVYYLHLVAQVALLTVDRLFRTEIGGVPESITVNLVSVMLNPATGQYEVIYVLSVTIPRARYVLLNLAAVDPVACLAEFNARMQARPGEFSPVTPWVEVQNGEVSVSVSDTPLLSMSPAEFEQLVAELLRRMNFRVLSVGGSGDGGVDCEAYDDRPIVGGRVVVQVKRYASTVSPGIVRELFGTVVAEGATKGVLVTTSGFGPEAREFAQGKPLELIDGVQLSALLRQYNLQANHPTAAMQAPATVLPIDMPPISPDGQYYWDGVNWQLVSSLTQSN